MSILSQILSRLIVLLLLMSGVNTSFAQKTGTPLDTLSIAKDTTELSLNDSLQVDSNRIPSPKIDVSVSKDALDDPIEYAAKDSIIYDIINKKILLYGDASVSYTTISLNANHIIFDYEKNEVLAEFTQDSLGNKFGLPKFKEGDQEFTSNKMRYNFMTRKGIIYDVTSQYNDIYILGSKAKFFSGQGETDSTEIKDFVYSQNAIFTTCDHPEPHFGIRSQKQKLVPNDVVVVGPSNLEIMGIPTPLWLPFGFFPITENRRQGLLFPRDYEYSERYGFGLRNIGYYLPINDYMDLSLTADIYFNGTFGLHATTNYRKRYKYNGNLRLNYARLKDEDSRGAPVVSPSFSIGWSHSQDSRAHPTIRLSGSVNIQTNNYQSQLQNDARSVLQNVLTSNVSFSKAFPDLPITFNASMNHSQNTRSGEVRINLPTIDFKTQSIYPFKRKVKEGKERWYEQIQMRYSNQLRNQFITSDSTLFTQQTLDDAQFGMKHDVNANTSFKLFKYFSLNPNMTYKEVWYLNSIDKQFDNLVEVDTTIIYNVDSTDNVLRLDTVSYGTLEEIRNNGFARYGQFQAGVSLNTQVFGTWTRNKGWLRGLRHSMRPSVSFGYTPDYSNPDLGYLKTVEYLNANGEFVEETFSVFQGGIYGVPSSSGLSASLGYSITNNFEAKFYSKKDSIENKVSLLDNFVISGNYNFAADSLKYSQITMRGTHRLFNGITTFNFGATLDPYASDEVGRRINTFHWANSRRPVRFVRADARLNSSISVGRIRELFQKQPEEGEENPTDRPQRPAPKDDILSLFERFNINHVFVLKWDALPDGTDTVYVQTHSLSTRGNIDLTDKWSVSVGNIGYDFASERLTYPDVGFFRKLHCWEMGVQWQPFRGTYQFYLRVSPSSSLNFINIPWQKRREDGFSGF